MQEGQVTQKRKDEKNLVPLKNRQKLNLPSSLSQEDFSQLENKKVESVDYKIKSLQSS